LGIAATALGIFVLSGLRHLDRLMKHDLHGTLRVTAEGELPAQEGGNKLIAAAGYKIKTSSVGYLNKVQERMLELELVWRASSENPEPPSFLGILAQTPHVLAVRWKLISI